MKARKRPFVEIVEHRGRLLVVQKTGWGKSFVYFIATKLLREARYAYRLTDNTEGVR